MTSDLWMCECGSVYAGEATGTVYHEEPTLGQCHRMGGCGWIVAVKRGFKDEARVRLLGVEAWAREERGSYDNRYIGAHLREVQLYVQQALVQLEYAELAEKDPQRTASNLTPKPEVFPLDKDAIMRSLITCRTCQRQETDCDCYT